MCIKAILIYTITEVKISLEVISMRNKRWTQAMIEVAVDKGIRDIKDDLYRGVRNVIDLGSRLSSGRFQKDIFAIFHSLMYDQNDSPYYALVKQIVDHVDSEIIKRVGMNIGYHGWTCGAETIRARKQKLGYGTPWCLTFDWRDSKGILSVDDLADLMKEAVTLGIYCAMIFSSAVNLQDMIRMDGDFPTCTFFLYTDAAAIDEFVAGQIRKMANIIPLLGLYEGLDPDVLRRAAGLLRGEQCLYGAFCFSNSDWADPDQARPFFDPYLGNDIPVLMLIRPHSRQDEESTALSNFIRTERKTKQYAVFLIDFYEDIAYINHVISGDDIFISIRSDGSVCHGHMDDVIPDFKLPGFTVDQILQKVSTISSK